MERIQRALDLARLPRTADIPAPPSHTSPEEREMLGAAARGAAPEPAQRLSVDHDGLRRRKVVLPAEVSAAGHAYRMLRAQLLRRTSAAGLGAIGVVSGASGEGKTLTAVNLALCLAADPNHGATLVDLDLRRPAVAATLGVRPPQGLETWFDAEGRSVSSVLYGIDGFERLLLVPTLAPVATASETLASTRTQELLESLRGVAGQRLLVVDLPPALLSDHVVTVGPLLDGFVLVVTEGKTRRDDVERVFELLGRERFLGSVLNRSSDSEQRAY